MFRNDSNENRTRDIYCVWKMRDYTTELLNIGTYILWMGARSIYTGMVAMRCRSSFLQLRLPSDYIILRLDMTMTVFQHGSQEVGIWMYEPEECWNLLELGRQLPRPRWRYVPK